MQTNILGLERPNGDIQNNIQNNHNNVPNENDNINNSVISNIYCNREFLLSEEYENINNEQFKPILNCPEITVQINKLDITALIDTGSNVTCLSEQWYNDNRQKIGKHEELPVTNTFIKTATNEKSRRISRIIMLPVTIQYHTTNIQILLVPNLVRPLIFGTDVLSIWKMAINFDREEINLIINNNHITLKFGTVNTEGITCHIFVDNSQRQNNNNEYNNDDYNDYGSTNAYNIISNISPEEVEESLSTNNILNSTQKKQLADLLLKYQDAFSEQPGLCNKHRHVSSLKKVSPAPVS